MAFQKGFFQKLLSVALFGLVLMTNRAYSQSGIVWGDSLVVRQAAHVISSPRIKTLGDGSAAALRGLPVECSRCSRRFAGKIYQKLKQINCFA